MSFQRVAGILDTKTGLIWDIEFKTGLNHDEALDYAKAQGKRLPTKEEFEEAEKNGIRDVPELCWDGYFFWSSTLHHDPSYAYVFNGYVGYIDFGYRVFRYGSDALRCVSAPSVKEAE